MLITIGHVAFAINFTWMLLQRRPVGATQPTLFRNAPDLEVWEAARDVAEAHALGTSALRVLNDSVACLLCLRAGFLIERGKLPHPAGMLR